MVARAVRGEAAGEPTVDDVNRFRAEYLRLGEEDLKTASRDATSLPEVIAVTAVVAARVLGLDMFDVQVRGALALAARPDRRDADRRGQDAGGRAGGRLVRALGRRRPRPHRQRLPRAARRRLDARDLRVVRPVGRRDPARHGAAGAPGGVPLRRDLRDGERGGLRLPARPARVVGGRAGAPAVCHRRRRRSRFDPDRRSADSSRDRRRRRRRTRPGRPCRPRRARPDARPPLHDRASRAKRRAHAGRRRAGGARVRIAGISSRASNLPLLTAVQDALHAHVAAATGTSTMSSRTVRSCRSTSSRAAPSRSGDGRPVCRPRSS